MIFLISSNAKNLRNELAKYSHTATVEAEYGDGVVEGSVLTMAHHGPRAGLPAPCSYSNECARGKKIEAVGLSHVDLDSLGGCAAILGRKTDADSFWELAEFVDLNGPHTLADSGASEADIRRLYAFWAWSQKHRVMAPRDGSVIEVTDAVMEDVDIIDCICVGDKQLLAAGDEFRSREHELNMHSFIKEIEGVLVRISPYFVNHLYRTPEGNLGKCVVALNTATGAINVSLADPKRTPSVSCCDIVQSLWGELAGGHAGIAGSPRGERMGLDELVRARDAAIVALK